MNEYKKQKQGQVKAVVYWIIDILLITAAIVLGLLVLASKAHGQDMPLKAIQTPKEALPVESGGVAPGTALAAGNTVRVTLYDNVTNKPSKWNLPIPHRVADRSFWLTQIAVEASTVVDIENTQYCFRSQPCQELDPIFFSKNPSRARMYEITGAINALAGYMTWRAKRIEDAEVAFGTRPQTPRWYTIPALIVGAHAVGTIWTKAQTGR